MTLKSFDSQGKSLIPSKSPNCAPRSARPTMSRRMSGLRLKNITQPSELAAKLGPRVILCPRLNGTRTDWYAQVVGKSGVWAQGRDRYQALGDLILHHPDEFEIRIEVTETEYSREETQSKLNGRR